MPSPNGRSEEHTSELQSPDTNSYAVFCLKKKKTSLKKQRLRLVEVAGNKQQTCQRAKVGSERERISTLTSANCFFFFNATATTEIYTVSDTLSLHDALPI